MIGQNYKNKNKMKIRSIILSIILASGLTAAAQNSSTAGSSLMIESTSRYDFAKTMDILSKAILEKGWKITITHDLQETMKKNGKEVLPVKVIEICNPGLAFNILSKDKLRLVSPMLPCRLSVYEKADGITYISRINAPAFAGMIDADAAKTVIQAFDEAEEFVKVVAK
jgi:uncharacterized protein (DUF302 family)